MRVCHGEFIDIFRTSEYFRNHPSLIKFWNGADEESLKDDPSLPIGWKVKIENRKVPKKGIYYDKYYYRPGLKLCFRSHIAMMEFNKYVEMKERKQKAAELQEKSKELKKKPIGNISLDPELPEYFKEHPSVISRWNGEESSLYEDPNLTGGWKIKLERRKKGKSSRQFVTPDRKYVIRTIEGVLEYLQHNDVQDDNIETLLETLLQMKNRKYKVPVPLVNGEGLSNNVEQEVANKRLKTEENINNRIEIGVRKTIEKHESKRKDGVADECSILEFNQDKGLSKSKFKLEDWGSECKDRIRRLGKNIGELEADSRLPYGWAVRLYGKNSKSSSKDFVTPDRKYYVRTHKAVVKYMRLSGNYSDFEISKTAEDLGVDIMDMEIEGNCQDSLEETITKMDDEKLLTEVEDEISDKHCCDKCEYITYDLMDLVLHKRSHHVDK